MLYAGSGSISKSAGCCRSQSIRSEEAGNFLKAKRPPEPQRTEVRDSWSGHQELPHQAPVLIVAEIRTQSGHNHHGRDNVRRTATQLCFIMTVSPRLLIDVADVPILWYDNPLQNSDGDAEQCLVKALPRI